MSEDILKESIKILPQEICNKLFIYKTTGLRIKIIVKNIVQA